MRVLVVGGTRYITEAAKKLVAAVGLMVAADSQGSAPCRAVARAAIEWPWRVPGADTEPAGVEWGYTPLRGSCPREACAAGAVSKPEHAPGSYG